jgi:hypothetical protein
VTYAVEPGRRAYVVPTIAPVLINGIEAPPRAGVAIAGETSLEIRAQQPTELILADLP